MRRAARTDTNHGELVDVIKAMGGTVQSLAPVGKGCPDLLVGWRNKNLLLEIKDGSRPPSERVLTPDQKRWHSDWKGKVYIVNTLDDLLLILKNVV
jgi:hypothetical protein